MAADRIDPADQIPETDLLEQHAAIDPPMTDEGPGHAGVPEITIELADEADRWEQHLSVADAEDDYPHDRFDAGDRTG